MRRATVLLLVVGGVLRAVSLSLARGAGTGAADDADTALLLAVGSVGVLVVVPLVTAWAVRRDAVGAGAATLTLGGIAAGSLVSTGLGLVGLAGTATTFTTAVMLQVTAALALALAAAVTIARWQDEGGPAQGDGVRWLRAVTVLAGVVVAGWAATDYVTVAGNVATELGVLPGPVRLAVQISPASIPIALGTLVPLSWAVVRAEPRQLRGAALVVGATGLSAVLRDLTLLELGVPFDALLVAPLVATSLLLLVVPAAVDQTTRVRA